MIYFLHCETTGLVKVGHTRDLDTLKRRLRYLRTQSSTKLTLRAILAVGSLADERAWHRAHDAQRSHGEWFRDVKVPPTEHDVAPYAQVVRPAFSKTLAFTCARCGVSVTLPGIRGRKPRSWCDACAAAGHEVGETRRLCAQAGISHETYKKRRKAGESHEAALGPRRRPGRRKGSGGTRTWSLVDRRLVLLDATARGVSAAARAAGVHRETLHKWKRKGVV